MANYLITGVSSFLGREFVNYLSKDVNNNIIATSRTLVDIDINLENLKYLSNIDLLKEEDIEILINETRIRFENPFNVIHCSGYYKGQEPLESMSFDESSRIFNSNFLTVYNLSVRLLDVMIEKGGGHFVGFSCNSVKYNYPQMAPFTAAKSALESFFRTVANEFYEKGIYANTFQLATLLTNYEISRKPFGDHKKWLKLDEVVTYVEQFLNQPNQLLNGNSIQLYHYSDSFFKESYYERIKK
jgi:NAD(P)-dependent dehydrogenase (short-subunit alcohol dehydrogenase family)